VEQQSVTDTSCVDLELYNSVVQCYVLRLRDILLVMYVGVIVLFSSLFYC